ncbi:MAG: CBS domain-containing protein [Chloroflexi bacterium]|nr:CBS domain-containing protein [Chloroflexota bacterium]
MKARDIMTSPALTVREDATVGDAAKIMAAQRISALPVVDAEDHVVGMLSHDDFFLHPVRYPGTDGHLFDLLGSYASPDTIEQVAQTVSMRPVSDVMQESVATIDEDEDVTEIARKMLHEVVKRLPVVRDGKIVGIVCRHDFVKLLVNARPS